MLKIESRNEVVKDLQMDGHTYMRDIQRFLMVHGHCKYSETCLKRPLKNRQNQDHLKGIWYLIAGQKYCRLLHGSILQYFWPALSDYRSWKPICGLLVSGRLRQVLQ